jgi:hypothetical protein
VPSDPELKCAYTGLKIELLQTSDKEAWFARVESPAGGYMTSLFSGVFAKESLIDFLRQRGGVLKGKPARPKIELRDLSAPAETEDERKKERDLDDQIQTAASSAVRIARDAGIISKS